MKGGLCVIYTSLLTISVLSSCAFFILVVSEAPQADNVDAVDLSGLHNVSKKASVEEPREEPPLQETKDSLDPQPVSDQEMTFADTLSLNSVTTDGLPDTVQAPILISLGDTARLDLRNPDDLLFVNDSEQHNDTKAFTLVETNETEEDKLPKKESTEPRLVVKAKPMHELRQTEEPFQSTPPPTEEPAPPNESHEEQTEDIPAAPTQVTAPPPPHEDIPSFSEWAQRQLAEAEKDTVLNHSSQPSHSNTNISSKSAKVRSKNYASPACGAKVVAVNPEAGSPGAILSPNRDEYMLNTCNSRIWFVVELCEAVQAQKIEIANFELFSSIPKEFAVSFSDRFPTRDWASVGQFTAKELRDVQSFDLFPHLFGKFIKVEMLSHHGSEHYCPISLFKVYGTSEFEVLEKESAAHAPHASAADADDEDDDEAPAADPEPARNLFGSARDAVMSIMKKAAQALGKTEVPKNVSSEHNDTSTDDMYKKCCSPSHIIVCDNCSETLYNEVYELISCSSDKLTNLVRQVFLRETLKCAGVCQAFGLDFKSTNTIEFSAERAAYMNALFPPKYLAALCNILAIKEKKVVLNTSYESESNVTINITVDESPQNVNSETSADQSVKLVPDANNVSDDKTNETTQTEEVMPVQVADVEPVVTLGEDKDKAEDQKEDIQVVVDEKTQVEVLDDNTSAEVEKTTESAVDIDSKDTTPKLDTKNGKESTTERVKDSNGNTEEGGDQISIDNDSFMSDFDQIAVDPTPTGAPASQNQNPQSTFQKESVFLRLSNRVKTLERNMSLSGQYLEELSRRYKKQVEEMQKTFEKTVLQMTEERRKSNEREQKYLEQMTTLQDQLTQMAVAMRILMEERESWFGNITFFKFVIFQIIIVGLVFYYITKRRKPEPVIVPISKKTRKKQEKLRRKSVEGVSGHETPSAKKRRPSEEALQIARQSADDARDDDDGEWQVARKNRRRKTSILHRNLENKEWTRQDSIGELQENPIPLDEEEFLAPVSEPIKFNNIEEAPKRETQKTNGFFNNLKSKTLKTRRLSSPAFLRTLSRQSTRSTPSPVVRPLEPLFNGHGPPGGPDSRKAASESPTSSLWSTSTEVSNGRLDVSAAGKQKRKSLKNIFKKVF